MFSADEYLMPRIGRTIAILAVITGTATAAPLLSDAQTRTTLAALARAGEDGLDPSAYTISALPDPAARDAAISATFLTYMRDVRIGRPELRTLDPDVVLPSADFDAAAAFNGAVSNGKLDTLLASLAPPGPDYASLKAALAHYRRIAAAGGWPLVSPGAESGLLRARLAFEDNITGLSDAAALMHFQARHGLTQDGTLGSATLSALNIPASARADTIVANMERWRWLPRQVEADRIVINVADARLDLFLGGKNVLSSRVVVGKPATPTPILRADGAGVTVNPPWTVPASIAAREILPKLKRNPAYLVSQDMVLLDGPAGDPQGLHVNWRAIPAGHFPYKLRQHPGAKNSLGRIKIELPNQFDVYLHDTPVKAAFNAPQRDVSHGCVRVEQILPLASYALASNLSAVQRISDAIDAGNTAYLPLAKKLPVYFLYWTAFVDEDGAIEFRPDIYGRDRRMLYAGHTERLAANLASCARG
jgi:murein L,D-transpeptidase YcbB/YkuD